MEKLFNYTSFYIFGADLGWRWRREFDQPVYFPVILICTI